MYWASRELERPECFPTLLTLPARLHPEFTARSGPGPYPIRMPPEEATRLRTWQGATVGTLFVGYTGYYVCRSVLPIASPFMLADPELGFDEVAYGRLIAAGIYAYAL